MIKPGAQTLPAGQQTQGQRKPVFPEYYQEDKQTERCNQGMFSSIDPRDIPAEGFTLVRNARNRFDTTSRRHGTSVFSPGKATADGNAVTKLYVKRLPGGTANIFRFTPSSIFTLGATKWLAITGPTLAGAATDQWSLATIFNKIAFSLNGLYPVGIIKNNGTYEFLQSPAGTDLNGNAVSAANAPTCKYVTGFYNRIVAAYRTDNSNDGPISIHWSGEINLGLSDWEDHLDWRANVDFSAGSTPLIDSPGDSVDFITGIQGFTNVLVVLREKSVWIGNKQPIASNPFRFYNAVPGIGSNVPYSLQVGIGGIFFADTRTRAVWFYQPGASLPQRVSSPVEPGANNNANSPILDLIGRESSAFSSFNAYHNEYSLLIPMGSYIKQWIYNTDTKAWSYDELPNVSSVVDADGFITSALTVAELSGFVASITPAPAGGVVAGWAGNQSVHSFRRYYGMPNGDIIQEDESVDTDSGAVYTTQWESKDFVFPLHDMLIDRIRIDCAVIKAGTVSIEWSNDTGLTWNTIRNAFTLAVGPMMITCNIKLYNAARIRWRLTSTGGLFSVTSHSIHIQRGGVTDERADIHG